jgi:hypothetical protein
VTTLIEASPIASGLDSGTIAASLDTADNKPSSFQYGWIQESALTIQLAARLLTMCHVTRYLPPRHSRLRRTSLWLQLTRDQSNSWDVTKVSFIYRYK